MTSAKDNLTSSPDFVEIVNPGSTRRTQPPDDELRPSKPVVATWARTIACDRNRKQALRAALAELPRGVTWDLVIEHDPDCYSLSEEATGELLLCTCSTITLRATEVAR